MPARRRSIPSTDERYGVNRRRFLRAAGVGTAGAVVAVVPVVAEVEEPVGVGVAVVVGWVVGATEVAAPATAGPPRPSLGLETAGDRSHPSPTPTATATSSAATSATVDPRRRPLWTAEPAPSPVGLSWIRSSTRPRR